MSIPYSCKEQIGDVQYKYDHTYVYSLAIHKYDAVWVRDEYGKYTEYREYNTTHHKTEKEKYEYDKFLKYNPNQACTSLKHTLKKFGITNTGPQDIYSIGDEATCDLL